MDTEAKELKSGFWIPDLRHMENVERLKRWDGQWGSLAALKFIRVTRESERVAESTFPPNGLS